MLTGASLVVQAFDYSMFVQTNCVVFISCSLEKDFFGFDEKRERILFTQSEADVAENISVKKSIFKK